MSTTVALTGLVPFVVLVAAALSLPVCWLLLQRYRHSVIAGMRDAAGAPPEPATGGRREAPPRSITIRDLEMRLAGARIADVATLRQAVRGGWPLAAVYGWAGLAYAVAMTAGWLLATNDTTIVATKLAVLGWSYLWPTVLAIIIVAAYDRTRRWQLFAIYFGVLVVITIVAAARNPDLGLLQVPLFWVLTNAAETVLLLTFLSRPIRAVGPIVLVFMLMIALGSQTLLTLAAANETILRTTASLGFGLGLGATGVFVGLILLGIGAFAALGWPLLRWIGGRYQAKKLSDESLTIDSLFLLFGVVQSIGLAFEGALWILTGLVAFAAYKLVTRLGFNLMRRRVSSARTLLLLRVFRLGKRSEQLFDKLRTHWLVVGSIRMIAGPDLVTTTIEPHEFLEFVSGRLGRQFVSGVTDLERRIAAMDAAPDPDGRYRINEFFCRANTWQLTMERLAATSDAVLMDLRSFSPSNQGCVFELGRLLDSVDLERVVFLVDETTDRAFLESTIARLWGQLSATSPNRLATAPAARLFQIGQQSERNMVALLGHLIA